MRNALISWQPASIDWVADRFREELGHLPQAHRELLERLSVQARAVPIDAHPGEAVVVVGEHEGRLLYWSDVEGGWEVDKPTSTGGIAERGSSQFDLSHVAWQLFGDPAEAWAVWRMDDNGNRSEVSRHPSRRAAEEVANQYEARGHKQSYYVRPTRHAAQQANAADEAPEA